MKSLLNKITVLVLVFAFSVPAYALTPKEQIDSLKDSLAAEIAGSPAALCQDTLIPVMDLELLNFLQFMEQNFQNKSSTSSLSNIAIARFSEYRMAINEHFAKVGVEEAIANVDTREDQLVAYNNCEKLKNSYIDAGKKSLIEYAKTNAAQKQSIVILDKYKSINDKLREMNLSIARMYSLLATFKQKIPGFVRECITN